MFILSGFHGNCHFKNDLSGCGIIAKCLPSSEQIAAIPNSDPLGLYGYSIVTLLLLSTYFIGELIELFLLYYTYE